jgi:hypothetical protein
MANFNLSGKIPVFNIALQIEVMGEIIHGKLDLIILFEIKSYPLEFLSFNDLIIFSTSYVEFTATSS